MFTAKDQNRHRLSLRHLHNFSFPNQVSWGSKKILRCESSVTAPSNQDPLPLTLTPSSVPESVAPEAVPPWNLRIRRSSCDSPAADPNPNPKERADFSLSLSYDEIEEDFIRIKGRKPYRRPKKRARVVQKKLDSLFPGLWLQEITADSYKTND